MVSNDFSEFSSSLYFGSSSEPVVLANTSSLSIFVVKPYKFRRQDGLFDAGQTQRQRPSKLHWFKGAQRSPASGRRLAYDPKLPCQIQLQEARLHRLLREVLPWTTVARPHQGGGAVHQRIDSLLARLNTAKTEHFPARNYKVSPNVKKYRHVPKSLV